MWLEESNIGLDSRRGGPQVTLARGKDGGFSGRNFPQALKLTLGKGLLGADTLPQFFSLTIWACSPQTLPKGKVLISSPFPITPYHSDFFSFIN